MYFSQKAKKGKVGLKWRFFRPKSSLGSKRTRSTIDFPYNDLDDALNVAQAVHENAGMDCTMDQLAAYLRQSPTSGTFRMRVSAARTFGLVETKRGGAVHLTPLGQRAADPNQEKAARAEAFLMVPLYKAVYEKFKGFSLPPTKALEREMQSFGVSPKQANKARQAFERSAQQAGYFEHGNDRLVAPALKDDGSGTKPLEEKAHPEIPAFGGGGGGDDLHPFIKGLLDELPAPKTEWPERDRAQWLQAAEHLFRLIYKSDQSGSVEIEFRPQNSNRMATPDDS